MSDKLEEWKRIRTADKFLEKNKYDMGDENYAKGKQMVAARMEALKDTANKAIRPSEDFKKGNITRSNPLEEVGRVSIDKHQNNINDKMKSITGDELLEKQAAYNAKKAPEMAEKAAKLAPIKNAEAIERRALKTAARQAAEVPKDAIINQFGRAIGKEGAEEAAKQVAKKSALQAIKKGGLKMLGAVAGPLAGIASAVQSGDVSAAVPGMESEALGLAKGMEGHEIESGGLARSIQQGVIPGRLADAIEGAVGDVERFKNPQPKMGPSNLDLKAEFMREQLNKLKKLPMPDRE